MEEGGGGFATFSVWQCSTLSKIHREEVKGDVCERRWHMGDWHRKGEGGKACTFLSFSPGWNVFNIMMKIYSLSFLFEWHLYFKPLG